MDTIFHTLTSNTITTLIAYDSYKIITYNSSIIHIYTTSFRLLYKYPLDGVVEIKMNNNRLFCVIIKNNKRYLYIMDIDTLQIIDEIDISHKEEKYNIEKNVYNKIHVIDNRVIYTRKDINSDEIIIKYLDSGKIESIAKRRNIKIYFIENKLFYTSNNEIYLIFYNSEENKYKDIYLITISNDDGNKDNDLTYDNPGHNNDMIIDIQYDNYLLIHTKNNVLFYKCDFTEKNKPLLFLENKIEGNFDVILYKNNYLYAFDGRMNIFNNFKNIQKIDSHSTPVISIFSIENILYSFSKDSVAVIYSLKYNNENYNDNKKIDNNNNKKSNNNVKNNIIIDTDNSITYTNPNNKIDFKKIYYQNNNIKVFNDFYCTLESDSLNFYQYANSNEEILLKIIIKEKIVNYIFNDDYLVYNTSKGVFICKIIKELKEDSIDYLRTINIESIENNIYMYLEENVLCYIATDKRVVKYNLDLLSKDMEVHGDNYNHCLSLLKGEDIEMNEIIRVGYLNGYIALSCISTDNFINEYIIEYKNNDKTECKMIFKSKCIFNDMVVIDGNIYLYDTSSIYLLEKELLNSKEKEMVVKLKRFYTGELIHKVVKYKNKLLIAYDKKYYKEENRVRVKKYGEKIRK